MKSSVSLFFVLIIGSAIALAQTTPTSSTPDFKIAPGTIIPVELTKSIDSKKLKEGDAVIAKLSVDMLSGGTVIVPRDSRYVGHVTEVKFRGKDQTESTLGIAFDRLILKNGEEMPLHAVVQAVGPPLVASMPGPAEQGTGPYGSPTPTSGGYGGHQGMGPPRTSGNPSQTAGSEDQPGNFRGAQPLPTNATGVVGIPGLTLRTTSSASCILASEKKNVKLESGSQLLLRIENP